MSASPPAHSSGRAGAAAAAIPSIYQVARELRREQHTLFNCLASILADAAFIQEIRLLYPDLPLLANLRAGGWYAPHPDGTCYFKSTDGHQNNCNFSVTRLNWHVAELAAQKGGLLVVDATRKGKRFPDALSKTVPIWAAVLNRAVARVRAYDEQKAQRRATFAAADGDVFTAVADTQTTISVRSSTSTSSTSSGSSEATSSSAAPPAAAKSQCRQPPLTAGRKIRQQPQQLEQQQQQQGLEQPQGLLLQQQQDLPGSSSHQQEVQELLVDCLGPSCLDLMSGLAACSATAVGASNSPAAVSTPEPCSTSSSAAPRGGAAADTAAASALAAAGVPPCCCLQRSKSVHISPQPSLHEWLDEMDVLRRLSLIADSRTCIRPAPRPRTSCPSGCASPPPQQAADHHARTAPLVPLCAARAVAAAAAVSAAGSAPAVSCLLASAAESADEAPPTPSALGCPRVQLPVRDVSAFEVADRAAAAASSGPLTPVVCRPGSPVMSSITAAVPAGLRLPCASKAAAPALEGLGPPAFLLSTGGAAAAGPEAEAAGEPVTPRLMFGASNTAAAMTTSSSSSRSSSGEVVVVAPHHLHHMQALQQQQQQGVGGDVAADVCQLDDVPAVAQQLRFAEQGLAVSQQGSSADRLLLPAEFAFPSPHELAATGATGSSVGAEAAGHLAASGLHPASSGSSCGSGLVRLPDMPVVVLNGTSHQPGDAASILNIWRGTDLEDVASLPGICNFRPGVYHQPPAQQQQQQQQDARTMAQMDDGSGWPSQEQQQQAAPAGSCCEQEGAGGAASSGSAARSSGSTTVSWAAEVCLRSQQQLSGRLSVSNWLDEEESGAACDALCAFAVPALSPPSCCSTNGSTETTEEAAATGSCGSQASGSVCSEEQDSRPSSRQSSISTAAAAGVAAAAAAAGQPPDSASASAAAPVAEWDTALHLPLWVSSHEREVIEAKLDGWVERLLEVGADVRGLAAVLTKPLRPLWVSQSSLIWTNQVAHPSALPFTPLLLVSASQPHAGERQAVKSAWLKLAKGQTATAAAGSPARSLAPAGCCSDGSSSEGSSDEEDGGGDAWDALDVGGCSWGSTSSSRARGSLNSKPSKAAAAAAAGRRRRSIKRGPSKSDLGGWSYVYVPGAGDDEESWAAGLTPALFWQHCDDLLRCGPHNVRPAVKQLLQLHKSACYGGAAASLAATAVRGLAATPGSSRPMSPLGQGSSSASRFGGSSRHGVPSVLTDKHHQAPKGCSEGAAGGASLHVLPAAPGAFWVGNTGLAVGNLEGASAADVWRAVGAVLCCGTAMVPVLQGEYHAMRLAAARVPATPAAAVAISSSAPSASSWVLLQRQQQQQQQQQQAKQAAGDPKKPLSSSFCTSSSSAAHSHWVRQQQQQQAAGSSGCEAAGESGSQQSPQLQFSKVQGSGAAAAAARKPVRKSGMLSALLSKAGASAQAALDSSTSSSSTGMPIDPAAAEDMQPVAACGGAGSLAGSEGSSSSVCSSSYHSICSEDGCGGVVLAPHAHASSSMSSSSSPALPRLKWLPVASAKKDRSSLKQHLQEALEFVSAHLAAGHTVLLHDAEGHDNCVCLAVAVLSGCFGLPAAASASAGDSSNAAEPSFTGPWLPSLQQQQQQEQQEGGAEPLQQLPPTPVSKQSVRQQLALVSGCYPLARPTRSMLKQVFNFFEERRRA